MALRACLAPATGAEAQRPSQAVRSRIFPFPCSRKSSNSADQWEIRIIKAALARANYHRQDTADLLGISRKSLHNKW